MDLSNLDVLNDNKYFQGALFLLYVIAGKEIFDTPAKNLKTVFHIPFVKYLIVFSAVFVVTKNIRESAILTLSYIILFEYLFCPGSGISLIKAPKQKSTMDDIIRPIHTQLEQPRNENNNKQQIQDNQQDNQQYNQQDKIDHFFQPMALDLDKY